MGRSAAMLPAFPAGNKSQGAQHCHHPGEAFFLSVLLLLLCQSSAPVTAHLHWHVSLNVTANAPLPGLLFTCHVEGIRTKLHRHTQGRKGRGGVEKAKDVRGGEAEEDEACARRKAPVPRARMSCLSSFSSVRGRRR